jgi:hypothetical protein
METSGYCGGRCAEKETMAMVVLKNEQKVSKNNEK